MQQNKDSSPKMHFLIGPHHPHKIKIERMRKERMAVVKINPEFFFDALTLINSGISKATEEEEESLGRGKKLEGICDTCFPTSEIQTYSVFFAK